MDKKKKLWASLPGHKKTTVGALGKSLPLGSVDHVAGAFVKDLATKPWKTKDERELGKAKKPSTTFADYVGMILHRLCPKMGGADMSRIEDIDEAQIQLRRMYTADILYAYVLLRTEAIGPIMELDISCGRCKEKFAFAGDLNTVEVSAFDNPADIHWHFTPEEPIEIRGRKVSKFRMGPMRWGSICELGKISKANNGGLSSELVKHTAARASICGLDDDPSIIELTDTELDELSKRDFERLIHEVNQNPYGPVMAIDGECPHCGTPFVGNIGWESDSFFAHSSR